ncbi:hypothetical protein AAVH_09471 [Aphelenchoides avenae]|nr:hypothetical protein AAVH_09471 [Aphelenchus avenae]
MTSDSSCLLSAKKYKEESARAPSQTVRLARKYKKRSSRVNPRPQKKPRKRVKFVEEPTVHRTPPLPKKPEGKVRMPEDEYPVRRDHVTIEGETITSPAIERRRNMRMKSLEKKLELLQRRQDEFFTAYSENVSQITSVETIPRDNSSLNAILAEVLELTNY